MRKHRMIQKTIRRVGLLFPIVVFAMLFIAATSNESAARKHKTGQKGKHGKIAQNAHRHGKHFARQSRHHRTPQRPLTNQEKDDIVQKIRTLAKSSAGTDELVVTTNLSKTSASVSSKDDSVIAAETSSTDVQSQIAEAAKEELAEDNVDISLDKYFKARPDASASATSAQSSAMADALNPAAEVERQQDFTLSDENDPNRAAQRSDVMAEIINWIGTRYEFGGEDRGGIDCSSFTKQVFEKAFGLDLPRTAYGQSQLGDPVTKDELQFGDLVFFKTARYAPITHVGIYIGEGLFANAACSRGVTVASMESAYWSAHYVGARRLLANSGTASVIVHSDKSMADRLDGSSN
jgi:cell wall-associated NlpC family hydrolase